MMLPTTRSPGSGLSIDSKDRVLSFVRSIGPVTPMQVARELKVESYMASAVLSELLGEKKIVMSCLRVGTSPLYLVRDQQDRLQAYIKHLNEKDRRTCAALKEAGILKDSSLDPLTRVSLRQIKDFAVPLEVELDGKKEVFWKWYLLSPEETEVIVRRNLGLTREPIAVATPKPDVRPKRPEEPKDKPEQEITPVRQKKLPSKDAFYSTVREYLAKNNIVVVHEHLNKKGDYDFTVRLPSAVGDLHYFCTAKSKKKINDGDLAASFLKAQEKKLPVLFIVSGDLTKQAKDLSLQKNIAVKKI